MTLQRGERYPLGRKAGKAARGPRCTGGAILPCSHSPGVQPHSGGEASQVRSIQNQKVILQRYADEHHFLNTRFFVDDGFSGVSFDREGLHAMLQEVEASHVATVITKDLSRLGRNYLKTGELIEVIFPEYDVRYIAINDGVDTAREDNEFTPLRNWFNEFYARDTSKKIRAVKQAKAQRASLPPHWELSPSVPASKLHLQLTGQDPL